MFKAGGERRKYEVKRGDLQHGDRHVGSGFERELPVEREVPEHRKDERGQVADPVGQVREFIEQGKGAELDEACAGGKQGEFDDSPEFFHLTLLVPGKCGIPGELNGEFLNAFIGTVELNTEYGIFGKANELPTGTPMEIADKNEVKQGDAYILANVDGNGIKKYRITIKNISKNDTAGKNMVIEITDSDLIAKTGGIVQGMSGSPIIQSNMLVGAVTHVFIDNPQKGYAIFA